MRRSLSSSKTVVLGVGNTIFSDDGVGVHAARLLKKDARLPADVTVLDGGTLGLELLAYVCDATRVLFLDAVNIGETPGTLSCMTADELLGISSGSNVHQLGVVDLIAAMMLVSDAPREIIVLGVQPANTDWGTELSPPIQAVLQPLVDAALAELRRWSASPAKTVNADFRLQAQPLL